MRLHPRNKILSILRQVLKQAWALQLMSDGDYLRAIDFKGIRGTKEPHGRFVNADEFARMVEICLQDKRHQGARDLALLVVLYVTCIRRNPGRRTILKPTMTYCAGRSTF